MISSKAKNQAIMINKPTIYLFCVLISASIVPASFAEIIMLKSKDYVLAYELAADGFKSVIDDDIVVYDMQSSVSKGRKIIKRVKRHLRSKKPPSAIFTIGQLATELASEELSNVPVIFCMVVNPEQSKISDKNNLGGVSFDISVRRQLIRMKQIVSSAENVGVIYDPKKSLNIIKEAREVVHDLNLNIIAKEVSSPKEVPDALEVLIKKIDLLWIIPDSTVLSRKSFQHINHTALRNCIPVMSCSPQLVELGSPFSFFSDAYSVGAQAGIICKKAINGEFKGAVPTEMPQEIFLAINLITLKRYGIKVPQDIIDSARHVYK